MSAPSSQHENEEKMHILIEPEEYEARIIRRLALRYRKQLTEKQLESLNRNLHTFFPIPEGYEGDLLSMIPDDYKDDGSMYIQGDAGIGKSEIPLSAVERFCQMAGLNLVTDVDEHYVPRENDFLFVMIDMSGKTNLSDITGGFGRVKVGGDVVDVVKPLEVASQSVAAYSLVRVSEVEIETQGDQRFASVRLSHTDPSILAECADGLKDAMASLVGDKAAATARVKTGEGYVEVRFDAPAAINESASRMLPNMSLASLSRAPFGMLMLDDIGNCPMHLRNAFLQAALDGNIHNVIDIGNVDVIMTANPPKSSYGLANTNVLSERSIPEMTRMATYTLKSSPASWVRYVRSKAKLKDNNGHFDTFIEKMADTPGFFNPVIDDQYVKGTPLPTPRSLTKAMMDARVYFHMAEQLDINPNEFSLQIMRDVASRVGYRFAREYMNHVFDIVGAPPANVIRQLDKDPESMARIEIDPIEYEAKIVRRLAVRYRKSLPKAAIERLNKAMATYMGLPQGASGDLLDLIPFDHKDDGSMYIQGDAGVGKSQIPENAIRRFCELAGLNFVKGVKDGYVPKENDFVYAMIDMSGKTNLSDITGGYGRVVLGADADPLGNFEAAVKSVAAYVRVKAEISPAETVNGQLTTKVTFSGADEETLKGCFESLAETMKATRQKDVLNGMKFEPGKDACTISVSVPAPVTTDASKMLPNVTLATLNHANYGMLMLDDIGNCPMHLRNVFLQAALNGKIHNVVDLSNIDIIMTANPPKSSYGIANTNVLSERSIPEMTRMASFTLKSTPESWVDYVMKNEKLNSNNGHFATFIAMRGSQPGFFHPNIGPDYVKGTPLPTPRSITKAMESVRTWFHAAQSMKLSPMVFAKEIQTDVSSRVGYQLSCEYMEHVRLMESEALPLAEICINTGKVDEAKFNEAGKVSAASGLDFQFRFGYALADIIAKKLRDNPADTASVDNLMIGLAHLKDDVRNAALTKMRENLEFVESLSREGFSNTKGRVLTEDAIKLFSASFGRKSGVFENPEQYYESMLVALVGVYSTKPKTATGKKPKASIGASPSP